MSNKNNFFPSTRGDKGLTVKKNKKNQITISFIGNNGPLTVVLDKENSVSFANHLLDLTAPDEEEITLSASAMDVSTFVNETLAGAKEIYSTGYDKGHPTIGDMDTKDHPFLHGFSKEPVEKLTGED